MVYTSTHPDILGTEAASNVPLPAVAEDLEGDVDATTPHRGAGRLDRSD